MNNLKANSPQKQTNKQINHTCKLLIETTQRLLTNKNDIHRYWDQFMKDLQTEETAEFTIIILYFNSSTNQQTNKLP